MVHDVFTRNTIFSVTGEVREGKTLSRKSEGGEGGVIKPFCKE